MRRIDFCITQLNPGVRVIKKKKKKKKKKRVRNPEDERAASRWRERETTGYESLEIAPTPLHSQSVRAHNSFHPSAPNCLGILISNPKIET